MRFTEFPAHKKGNLYASLGLTGMKKKTVIVCVKTFLPF